MDSMEPWKARNRDLRGVFLHNVNLNLTHTAILKEMDLFKQACARRLDAENWPVIGIIEVEQHGETKKVDSPARVYLRMAVSDKTKQRVGYKAFYAEI